jgi:predicted dehydrogenase
VTDLMIHDLDIVRTIVGCAVVDVSATARLIRSSSADLACALLTFENGATANVTASRVGQQKVRELRITQAESFVNVDLIRMDVTVNRVEHSEFLSDSGARYRQTGMVEIPFLEHRGEPLALEQAEFVRAVTTRSSPRVTGHDGLEALRLVQRVLAAAAQ